MKLSHRFWFIFLIMVFSGEANGQRKFDKTIPETATTMDKSGPQCPVFDAGSLEKPAYLTFFIEESIEISAGNSTAAASEKYFENLSLEAQKSIKNV